MAEVVCVDGSVLTLLPVPKLDRSGAAYEVTLRLLRDGRPFGEVGECSGWLLSQTAERLRAVQADAGPDAFPPSVLDAVLDSGLVSDGDRPVLRSLLPRDRELLCLRARDPDDGDPSGELRLWVRDDRTWHDARDGVRGRWSLRARAVLDAWGGDGTGLRALLDGPALLHLLDRMVDEAGAVRDDERLQVRATGAEHPV